jgi:hypothetical protein
MPARKEISMDDVNIISNAWGEIKKINWHEINRLAQQNYYIGLVGSPDDIAAMRAWLRTFPRYMSLDYIPNRTNYSFKEMEKRTVEISPEALDPDDKLIKSSMFCLVTPEHMNQIRRNKVDCYRFEPNGDNHALPPQILSNHIDMRFALSYNFPVFRSKHANREISNTALQNATWAILTGMPNTIPGPHRIISIPLEGISDFAFLTLNEIKLMFELIGLSGYRVRPLHHIIEFGIVLVMAMAAETMATNIISKMPTSLALLTKGAIAYAFTWTIGEAIFYYLNTGQKAGQHFIQQRFKRHYGAGKQVAQQIIVQGLSQK